MKVARRAYEKVTFVPVERVFSPQVKVRAKHDLSGWADREKGIKWHIPTGRIGYIDEEKAREFFVKGYVDILDGTIRPVSEDETAEILSTRTVLSLGE